MCEYNLKFSPALVNMPVTHQGNCIGYKKMCSANLELWINVLATKLNVMMESACVKVLSEE